MSLFFVGATSGLATARGPVGGGVRVLEAALASLPSDAPRAVHVYATGKAQGSVAEGRIGLPVPALEGAGAERVIALSEWEYTRFSREFAAASTELLLRVGRPGDVVICNDIAEGPSFARLAAAGLVVVSLFHVLVAEFFCRMYLADLLAPRTLVRAFAAWRRLGGPVPELLRLVFVKEAEAVASSALLVVPSAGMASSLEAIYAPGGDRIRALPWRLAAPDPRPARRRSGGRQTWLTLSRISWEKGLDVLFDALARLGPRPVRVLVCGEAAYMGGARYLRKLRARAARLPIPVEFPGYVTGERKRALLDEADLFLSTSHYEAYGLTIEEALARGVPVVSLDHHGARAHARHLTLVPGRGRRERVAHLAAVLDGLVEPPPGRPPPPPAGEPLGVRLWELIRQAGRAAGKVRAASL